MSIGWTFTFAYVKYCWEERLYPEGEVITLLIPLKTIRRTNILSTSAARASKYKFLISMQDSNPSRLFGKSKLNSYDNIKLNPNSWMSSRPARLHTCTPWSAGPFSAAGSPSSSCDTSASLSPTRIAWDGRRHKTWMPLTPRHLGLLWPEYST